MSILGGMLFNSLEFILLFLPITLVIFFQIGQRGKYRWAIGMLLAASIFFYGWWNPTNLLVLIPSIGFNYGIGNELSRPTGKLPRKWLLTIGIGSNLLLLGYFKYAHFFATTASQLLGANWNVGTILLPLGISFFTFQQIGYLIDAYRDGTQTRYRFLDYALFVALFPHLLAGPIVQHKEIIPQFAKQSLYYFKSSNLAIGITIFAIGLFKKVVLADGVAGYANQVFAASAAGASLTLVEAWVGALAFTLQLYFDFSGYSDMAIGLGRMFGIWLPINFNSPYKAVSIIDFWRRWHITLSNFLRDYLYIPLGGNRQGEVQRGINLMLTMLLGGLWHGAGWTFVLWGGLHGIYLIVNHQWRSLRQRIVGTAQPASPLEVKLGAGLTFMAVVIGWVIFRSPTIPAAISLLGSMVGSAGIQFADLMPNLSLEIEQVEDVYEISAIVPILHLASLLAIVWYLPNSQQWVNWLPLPDQHPQSNASVDSSQIPARSRFFTWQPTTKWAIITMGMTAIALLNLSHVSEFLYFEF